MAATIENGSEAMQTNAAVKRPPTKLTTLTKAGQHPTRLEERGGRP